MRITKFNLGRMVATSSVLDHPEVSKVIPSLLRRHRNCDYGDISKEDATLNNSALRMMNGRVLSVYQVQAKRVRVITDGLGTEDLATTVLFPEEY